MSIQGRKIQGKKSKTQDLEETANKLRTIKERQGQWMREREEAKTSSGSQSLLSIKSAENSRVKANSTRSSSNSDQSLNVEPRGPSRAKNPFSNPRRKPLYEPPKIDHSNIVTWSGKSDSTRKSGRPSSAQRKQPSSVKLSNMDGGKNSYTKSQSLNEKPYLPSNYSSVRNNSTKEPDAPSMYSKLHPITSGFSDQGEILKSKADGEKFGMEGGRESVDYEDHGSVEVTDRSELTNEKAFSNFPPEINADVIDALAETVARKLKTTIDPRKSHKNNTSRTKVNDQGDDQEMSTHKCPTCQSLMSGTTHTPMALIPCGHTLCKECSRDCKKCPSCQTRISTFAVNTVLQQIISDFLSQKERKRLEKMEMETRKYVDEYQSLSLRSNALAEEADVILNGMEDLTEKLFQEKKLLKKLEVDNDDLTRKISEFQNQLDRNRTKMLEREERCQSIEGNYEEEKQRLALVEDTVKIITQSKERVKMLVKNFAPSFNLDQFD